MRILPLACAALALTAVDASAARYVAKPADGGRIVLNSATAGCFACARRYPPAA